MCITARYDGLHRLFAATLIRTFECFTKDLYQRAVTSDENCIAT